MKGGVRMRWKGNGGKIGCLTVLLGIFLLLALVLPPGFWWFVLGVLLIFVGFWIMRCR
ncbi:MAG: hypothetical protein ACI3UZ_06305 [Oscillospiraceae bacterium]|nr:hypothetical protein [Oscillospiraceae bacterium]